MYFSVNFTARTHLGPKSDVCCSHPLYFLYLLVNGVFNFFLFLILLIFSEVLIAGEPTIMGGASEEDERPITRIQNSENGTEPPKEEHNINIKSEVDG